jgi:hypothetical protein
MDCIENFHPANIPESQCKYVKKILYKYVLGLFICRPGGDVLYTFQISPEIRVNLISQFVAALSIFGEENLGKIKRILIEGLDIEMNIVTAHDLIMVVFFRPNMVKDYLQDESLKALESFYNKFKDVLVNGKSNQEIFRRFDDEMCLLIQEYLVRLGVLKIAACDT